ncbi:AMP-binding protein [Verticiella sediminum]|uniref:AMP-binding protein n=1 Tax=Verticiella sediminum TaxID=1247510 RepID=A0A556AGL2_9BURK|nr:AMP-binding protein [Verticiella sediminum]TSH92027.1 AMP-binding protein [Verticiella sediminum]
MPGEWNFADVWEAIAATTPEAIAQVHGQERITWQQFDAAADGIAHALLEAGVQRQDKVALYLRNGPAYLQSAFGCMKAGLVPVNTNYRYREEELHYLWDNADAVAVVFHGEFTETIEAIRARCRKVRLWIHVDDGTFPCPAWAQSYASLAHAAVQRARAPWGRSGDDIILIYTGGTTGRPRGVMWRQHDLYMASNTTDDPPQARLEHVRSRVANAAAQRKTPSGLPAAPLMHGTAYVFAGTILSRGGTLVTLTGRNFDAAELLTTVQRAAVTDLCIVGDAFCRPMVEALDAEPERWDISGLKAVSSSGMMWSDTNKARLLRHAPAVMLIDFLNSSEASGMGRAITSSRQRTASARFTLGRNAFVIDDAGRPVRPGSGVAGRVAVRGAVPLGYYGDPKKTAETFPVIDGERCAIPGDFARVEADGSIVLLGRGSVSINTGGEKVFPEEVEECIKQLAPVRDAVVVGIPDERFGEVVAAIVESAPASDLTAAQISAHVRERLAGHKTPRHVMLVASLGRGPNGKADYPALRQRVADWLKAQASSRETRPQPGMPA